MNYSVEQVTLADDHPYWPNGTFYKLRYNRTGEFGMGMYTTLEAALSMCEVAELKLNKILGRG